MKFVTDKKVMSWEDKVKALPVIHFKLFPVKYSSHGIYVRPHSFLQGHNNYLICAVVSLHANHVVFMCTVIL